MSKIEREQLIKLAMDNDFTSAALIDKYMALIDQREAGHQKEMDALKADFQVLVDAAVAWHSHQNVSMVAPTNSIGVLREAIKPFLPPPDPHKQLAERLTDALFNVGGESGHSCTRIEFKSGGDLNVNEISLGGFCKDALVRFFEKELEAEIEKLGVSDD